MAAAIANRMASFFVLRKSCRSTKTTHLICNGYLEGKVENEKT